MTDDVMQWLLDADPWTAYITRRDLLEETLSPQERDGYIAQITADPKVVQLVEDVRGYFPMTATRHTDAKLTHYKLRMLSDLGLTVEDGLQDIAELLKGKQDGGLVAIRQSLPFTEAGADEWHALPCDNPQIVCSLKRMGDTDELLTHQLEHLAEMWSEPSGWFCHFPFVEGQFKREQKACPMAGLYALEAFAEDDTLRESEPARNAFQSIVYHFELGKPIYYFGRGKKFFTYKYPFVWYNALYMADVLSRFAFTKGHPVLAQLTDWIEAGEENGRYQPTSMYMEYKGWEFSNKKECSPWITLLCHRILKRCR